MIKRKVIELENIGFEKNNEQRESVDATVSLNRLDSDDPEMEVAVGSIKVLIPVQDVLDCLVELNFDLPAWVETRFSEDD